MIRVFRDADSGRSKEDLLTFALGAVGGVALGVLLARVVREPVGLGSELRERARTVARRFGPARLRRPAIEQGELDELETIVLEAFLGDSVLSERGVDIGAISRGIIELSGTVRTEGEAERAVSLASGIPGVRTVVNRLEMEDQWRRGRPQRPADRDDRSTFGRQEARVGGMGRRRQSATTDPDRPDESQHLSEVARAAADRDQLADEGFSGYQGPPGAKEAEGIRPDRYSEDDLDNQDPHGQHAERTLDSPPQQLRTQTRVGEGLKPATELRFQKSGIPLDSKERKPQEGREENAD